MREPATIPPAKGTYVLIAHLPADRSMQIGRFGTFEFRSGYYAYVGSAFGPGGLRARIRHHSATSSRPHWHIDYLLRHATLLEAWFTAAPERMEDPWAILLAASSRFKTPIPGFGASDSRQSGATHLFHSHRRPSFRWFKALPHQPIIGRVIQSGTPSTPVVCPEGR